MAVTVISAQNKEISSDKSTERTTEKIKNGPRGFEVNLM